MYKCSQPAKIKRMIKSLWLMKNKRMLKSLRPVKIRRIVKSLWPVKIRRIVKSLRSVKIRRIVKSLRPVKIGRIVKSLRPVKIRRIVKSLQPVKIKRIVKSLRALKSLRLVKYQRLQKSWRNWKSRGPAYCSGSAESPTADFSLVPLMSMFSSSLMWWISHVVSPVLHRLFVPARHAKKWLKSTRQPKVWLPPGIPLIYVKSQQSLTLLTSVLSLSRKNVDNHYCCPISAITLTTSKLEAILKIYRGSLKLSKRGRGVRGGEVRGGREGGRRPYGASYQVMEERGGGRQTAK